jgi:hypothetical protein
VTISWRQLCEDPSLWIRPECVPDDFQWADPSKIRVGEVFRLLEHWKRRQEEHLKPLIWASTCPILQDVDRSSSSEHTSGHSSTDSTESADNSDSDSNSYDRRRSSDDSENFISDNGHGSQTNGNNAPDVGEDHDQVRDDDKSITASPRRSGSRFQQEGSGM